MIPELPVSLMLIKNKNKKLAYSGQLNSLTDWQMAIQWKKYEEHYVPSSLVPSNLLIRFAVYFSSSYPVVLRRLNARRKIQISKSRESNPRIHG